MYLFSMYVNIPVLIFSVLFSCAVADTGDTSPVVTTKYGKIEGIWKESYEGRKYAVFEGIPYAKPPIGELRFEDPQPVAPWYGTWKATRINKCIQIYLLFNRTDFIGDEDCLYLNIYVPKLESDTKKLDVVVHIHGGGFAEGYSAEYTNEKFVMDRDVIYATMHYRLGAFGFLSTEDDIVRGNMGLKDQTLAMKWIKENIENFGGNSESITLTGFSAGACSVHYHYLSPLSRNLFNRGMSVSGSSLNNFALQKNPAKRAELLAKVVGCESTNRRVMINCMKSRPAYVITEKTQTEVHPAPPYLYIMFSPVIEKESEHAFISKHPYELLKQGKVYDLPWVASVTTHEGALFSLPFQKAFQDIDKNWNNLVKFLNQYDETLPESKEKEIAEKIRRFYIPNGKAIDESQMEQITKMWTDRIIAVDTILAAQIQSKANKSPVYFYQFGYQSPHSLKTVWGKSEYEGVPHGDDMAYFFGGMISKEISAQELKMKNIALDMLYTYAHEGTPSVPNVTWKPIGKEFNFLKISGPNDLRPSVKTDFSSENFWASLGLLENGNLFPDRTKNEL